MLYVKTIPLDGAEVSEPQLRLFTDEVDRLVKSAISEPSSPLSEAAMRIASAGGKRLRARLVLASATAIVGALRASAKLSDLAAAAASVELLHAATLVHDDVIDRSSERRGVVTINAAEGVEWAILAGDMMASRALGLASNCVSGNAPSMLAYALEAVCDGQAIETAARGNWSRTSDSYFAGVSGKTAVLFGVSCAMGVHETTRNRDATRVAFEVGHSCGMAFQILDDIRDLSGTSEDKPSLQDLGAGIATLPVILGLAAMGETTRGVVVEWLRSGRFEASRSALIDAGGVELAESVANNYRQAAYDRLRVAAFAGDTSFLEECMSDAIPSVALPVR